MSDTDAIDRALCCGRACLRPDIDRHGDCAAATYGRTKRLALQAAGYTVTPIADDTHAEPRPYPTIPIRVVMPAGIVHLIRRCGLSVAIAEYPDATRVERADRRQPPLLIEDQTDA